jgi:hypothetical protein
MSYGRGVVLVVFAVACDSPKKPPPESAFVLNPPAAARARVADTSTPMVPAPVTKAAEPRKAPPKPEPAKREAPEPPPPAPSPAPVPPPAATEQAPVDESLLFNDDFAHGNRCARGGSQHGFGWAEVQSGDPDSVVTVRDPDSPSGCALAFVFGGSSNLADDAWAEQRFRVGQVRGEPLREVFVGFVIHTPPNYVHRDAKGPDNNKLLRLWDRSYNKSMVHLGMSTMPRKQPFGSSQLEVEYSTPRGSEGKGPWSPAFRANGVDTVGFYVRTSSGIGMPDGAIRIWWNRRLVYDQAGLMLAKPQAAPGAFNGIGNGYLLGWSNSGFSERTEFHVWRFVIAPQPVAWFLPSGR